MRTRNEQNKRRSPERLPAWEESVEDCPISTRKGVRVAGEDSNLRLPGYDPGTLPSASSRDIYLAGAPAKSVKKRYWFLYRPVHKRVTWREWDSNPCVQKDKRFLRPSRCHFDISPNILAHRITRNFPNKTAYPDGRVPGPFSETPPKLPFLVCRTTQWQEETKIFAD